jgi:hypothetical protein
MEMSMTETQQAVIKWLANGKTGLSSETMAFWLAFGILPDDSSYPADPADFNRCLGLLAVAPALRADLGKMKSVSKRWARLVDRWDEIERTFIEEVGLNWSKGRSLGAGKTFALMDVVMEDAEAAA